jgi:hypothetical protein
MRSNPRRSYPQNQVHQRLEKKMDKRQPNNRSILYKTATKAADKLFSNYYEPLADQEEPVNPRMNTITVRNKPKEQGCYIHPQEMKEFLRWKKNRRQFQEWERLKKDYAYASYDQVMNECAFSKANVMFNRSIWLGDTAASAHMGNTDEGMTDLIEVHEEIMIGNGKKIVVTKIGTLHRTAFQEDGTTLDIQLKGYKYAPQLHVNLFSITKALDQD